MVAKRRKQGARIPVNDGELRLSRLSGLSHPPATGVDEEDGPGDGSRGRQTQLQAGLEALRPPGLTRPASLSKIELRRVYSFGRGMDSYIAPPSGKISGDHEEHIGSGEDYDWEEAWIPEEMAYGLEYCEVPRRMRLPHIHGGYRLGGTWWNANQSLFRWHNETLRAWTMIINDVWAIYLSYAALAGPVASCATATGVDALIFACFGFHVVLHSFFSIQCHLNLGRVKGGSYFWHKTDVSFIFIAGILCCVSQAWYLLPREITAVLLAVESLVAIGGTIKVCMTNYDYPARVVDSALAGITTLVYLLPSLYTGTRILVDSGGSSDGGLLVAGLGAGLALFVGGLSFSMHFPECLAPGKLDCTLASGNILHLCLWCVVFCEWVVVLEGFALYHGIPRPIIADVLLLRTP